MISQRASALAPSETLKISARAKELQREGKPVISLSAGEPDFKTPRFICDAAIQAINDGHHGYTPNTGTPELKELIVAKLKRDNGLEYKTNQVIVSNGAKQSVGFAMLAVLNPGDEVIIPAPFWVSYPAMAQLAEATSVVVRTAFENDYKITPAQLEAAITPKTKLFVLCTPSNPTGSCYSEDELKALAEVFRKYPNILILSDEIYEYISFDAPHVSFAKAAPDLINRVITVNGFSKGYAMTGWRLGYIAASPEIVGAVDKLQSQETSAPSTISQKAGEAALKGGLEEIYAMRDSFKLRRDFVVDSLNSIPGVKCFKPKGAFYAFPDVSAYFGKTTPKGQKIETSTDLIMYLLDDVQIATVPGDAFGEPNGIRLSYATSMENLEEALSRLKKGLAALV